MVQRIVLIKLDDPFTEPAARSEIAEYSRKEIARVPGVRDVTVGISADEATEGDWDLSLVVHFDRIEDVAPYGAHPVHRAYVDDYLRPKLAFIKAWNFAVR